MSFFKTLLTNLLLLNHLVSKCGKVRWSIITKLYTYHEKCCSKYHNIDSLCNLYLTIIEKLLKISEVNFVNYLIIQALEYINELALRQIVNLFNINKLISSEDVEHEINNLIKYLVGNVKDINIKNTFFNQELGILEVTYEFNNADKVLGKLMNFEGNFNISIFGNTYKLFEKFFIIELRVFNERTLKLKIFIRPFAEDFSAIINTFVNELNKLVKTYTKLLLCLNYLNTLLEVLKCY